MKKIEKVLFFLTVLFLPTQLGRHFWPDFAYVYSIRIDYLSPTIYFWNILCLLLVLVFLYQGRRINKTALNLTLIFLLSQVVSLLPNIATDGLGVGFVRLEEYIFASLFGLYIASQNLKDLKNAIFLPLLISTFFESSLAILQFLKGGTIGFWVLGERAFSLSTPAIAKFDFYGRQFLRPYATFPHPNVLAGFLLIALGIIDFCSNKDFAKKLWFKGVMGLSMVAAVFTASRVALLAGFCQALLIFNKKSKIALLIFVLILSPLLFTRFSAVLNFDNLSFVRREELSNLAVNLFFKSPLFGIGLNNFIPKASDELLSGPSRFLQPVHNIFLLSLSETGIVGFLGLILLIGYPIMNLKFKISNLKLLWVVIIFLGLFDHYFLTLAQGYRLLFLVWGVSMSMLEYSSAKSH